MERDGVAIAYSDEGSGPFVGYAHGLFISRRLERWLRLADLSQVYEGRRYVEYDARGHGLTGGRREVEDYRWSNLAGDLVALLDEVGVDGPVDFMGTSMGTGTLLWAAVQEPRRFRRLVLMMPSTAWETRPAQAQFYRELADVAEAEGKAAVMTRFAEQAPAPILEERFAELAENPTAPPAEMPDVPEELLPWVMRGAAVSDYPSAEEVAGLGQPALILAEAGDPGHPESTARRLHELLPNSELHVARNLAAMRQWGARIDGFLRG
jgi:pimeloyl-ACP methyl ester carboxylesterase